MTLMTLFPRAGTVLSPAGTLFPRVVAALTLAAALGGCSAGAAPAGTAASGAVPAASAPGPAEPVPPYYAALSAARPPAWDSPQDVTVRDTGTARTLLTVRPPAPYQTFSFVTGTGVAGRWVVGAQRWHAGLFTGDENASQFNKLYLLAYDAADGRTALTALPGAPVRDNQLVGNVTATEAKAGTRLLAAVALSPDGRLLATVMTSATGYQVQVTPVAGGAARSWTEAVPVPAATYQGRSVPAPYETQFSLTWLGDQRTLAIGTYSYDAAAGVGTQVRYLDTEAPGGALTAASRLVIPSFPPAPHFTGMSPARPAPQSCDVPVATAGGTVIVCGGAAATGVNNGGYRNVGFWVLSARTGRLAGDWAPHGNCRPHRGQRHLRGDRAVHPRGLRRAAPDPVARPHLRPRPGGPHRA